jgi:hypothetical protein
MFDLQMERALRRLAEDSETGREDLLQAIVRDWLFDHRCFDEDATSNVVTLRFPNERASRAGWPHHFKSSFWASSIAFNPSAV